MEWVSCIKEAIRFIEEHLLDSISPQDVAKHVHISYMYLQNGFQILTGYSISEYIRNRRLYEASRDILEAKEKIIDIAYKYGYETPESFTKAYFRFHGITPIESRKRPDAICSFYPLQIELKIKGGKNMDYIVEELPGFQVVGFARSFSFETSYLEIPKFWDEVYQKYTSKVYFSNSIETELDKSILKHHIGEYGVCLAEANPDGKFKYLIAGIYLGGDIPKELEIIDIPRSLWAKFKCVGPMPKALQEVNTRIYKEWLPGNKEYEIDGKYDIEWYSSDGNMDSEDYISEIWIPVKRK